MIMEVMSSWKSVVSVRIFVDRAKQKPIAFLELVFVVDIKQYWVPGE